MNEILNTVIVGDVLDEATWAGISDESVQCVVTSPPYWGLRDYGTVKWEGGDSKCDHKAGPLASRKSTLKGYTSKSKLADTKQGGIPYRDICGKCGARRIDSQLGLEPTLEEYVEKLVQVFRHVRRVLRDDGTVWLNLGDSYASKDLVGIPWRVAFALQADGWYLRQDIIWAKPSPMPESARDRCTKAHEYIFLLTKRPRYFYDAEAVKENSINSWNPKRSFGMPRAKEDFMTEEQRQMQRTQFLSNTYHDDIEKIGRNKRSVWTIPAQGFSEAHFATFPERLVVPCIQAGTSEKGCCPVCLAPWARRLKTEKLKRERLNDITKRKGEEGTGNFCPNTVVGVNNSTIGWKPTCEHDAEPRPCIVLDPFLGSGTVGLVAQKLNRFWIGIELNPGYAEMAKRRISKAPVSMKIVEALPKNPDRIESKMKFF